MQDPTQHAWPTALDERFRCIRLIGGGGMGAVFLAEDRETDERVAIKTLLPAFGNQSRARRRFLREARAVFRLRHPSIVGMRDYVEIDGVPPALVMEYVRGTPLSQIAFQPEHWPRFARIFAQVLDGLAYAHSRGVIHRDLKPDNILVTGLATDDPQVRIVDFGLAHFDEVDPRKDTAPLTGAQIAGTVAYMAPEQFVVDRKVTPLVDIYAFGVLIFAVITGRLPWGAYDDPGTLMVEKLESPVRSFELLARAKAPPGLAGIAARCLRRIPIQRYWFASDVRRALVALPFDGPPIFSTSVDPEPAPQRSRCAPTPTRVLVGRIATEDGASALSGSVRSILSQPPFVGRAVERGAIEAAMSRVIRTKQSEGIILCGPSGIGKSRLVEWFREVCVRNGRMLPITIDGKSFDSDKSIRNALVRCLTAAGAEVPEQRDWVRESLQHLGITDTLDLTRIEDALLTVRTPTAESGRAGKWRIYAEVIARIAQKRPVCLLAEGLAEITDQATVKFLEWLVTERTIRNVPVMVLGALRTDEGIDSSHVDIERSGVFDVSPLTFIDLDGLRDDEMTDLLQQLGAAADVIPVLTRLSKGNPLVAREWIWSAGGNARPTFAADAPPSAILADLFNLRLDVSSIDERRRHQLLRLLRGIAIGPPSIPIDMLERVVIRAWPDLPPARIQSLLWLAIGERILCERGGDDPLIEFQHEVWREVMILTDAEQDTWHGAWESVLAELAEDFWTLRQRASHLLGRNEVARAIQFALEAGDRALAQGYVEVAERCYRDVSKWQYLDRSREPDPRVWARATLGRAHVEHSLRRLVNVSQITTSIIAKDTALPPRLVGDAYLLRARATVESGRPAEAVDDLRDAAQRYDRVEDRANVAKCALLHAEIELASGEVDAAEMHLERALDLAFKADALELQGEILSARARVEQLRSNHVRAEQYLSAAARVFTEAGDHAGIARCLGYAGAIALQRGDIVRARTHFASALESAHARGDFHEVAVQRLNLASLELSADNVKEAQTFLSTSGRPSLGSQSTLIGLPLAALNAEMALALGDVDEGRDALRSAFARDRSGVSTQHLAQASFRRSRELLAAHGALDPQLDLELKQHLGEVEDELT